MDTRTQRKDKLTEDTGQIIDPLQLASLCDWMSKYPKDLKFIVTSVPFVAEINEKGSKGEPKWSGQPEPRNLPNDKWDADRFRDQRDAIIDHIFNNNIERVVFLTGDMHCCYHATMQVGSGSKYTSTIIHELAGGPVNQLQLANEVEFDISTKGRTKTNVDYVVLLDQFHTQMSGVMHVKVDYVKREQVTGVGRSIVPEVTWNVIRTLTDDGAERWVPLSAGAPKPGAKLVPLQATALGGDPVMNGVITFSPRRHIGELKPWLTEVV
jgi:hypothetical protein